MQDLKLGQIITEPQQRDAIHIAVAPVTAVTDLQPGQHVGVQDGGAFESASPVGVVDPFLKAPIQKGQRFWLFLYPNTITSLRHEWAHPGFDTRSDKEVSRQWIEDFAAQLDQTYNRLMAAAQEYSEYGDWTYDNSETYKRDGNWERFPEFWKHYEIVTGKKVTCHEDVPFTCSC